MTAEQWTATRVAVRETGDRFAALVNATVPETMATADWTVADTAAHVVLIAWLDNLLLDPGLAPPTIPGLMDEIAVTTVDTVDKLNDHCLRHFAERDPRKLAQRLRAEIDRLLLVTADLDPELPVAWLGGSRVPVGGLLAHLVNELLIHGHDIARATRTRWDMAPKDAATFLAVFVLGMVRHGIGRIQERAETPSDRRIAVEFRSKYTAPAVMVVRGHDVSIGEPGRDIDARVSYDPVTLNLMLFGRVSRARALLTGKVVVVGGRRPWLLPAFMRTVRFPS
ncbi:maleylpyruvate isomerase family mycothiol-dependent enzyme [Actinomadura alba]|uniref:Maleylpyruvate isomerase family mycothiol-dependent enzyme n=1 Tax=Actinomadura alba TaxID=406431 RepID=A0ABR7LSF5_9ACTN|nr:maleylpyruvate isomerase family mycothiol-dependent enzyme [Actinomadura alba]